MSRTAIPATIEASPEKSQPLLKSVQAAFGATPNIFRLVGISPASLQGFLGFSGALATGTLDRATRERIALAVANVNGCDYCNAAHTLAGKAARLGEEEIAAARSGRSSDLKVDVAVRFARLVAERRAEVSEADLAELRLAGYDDAQIVEIVAHVALNVFTNYVNEVFKTPIDFPAVGPATRAA